MHKSLMVNKFRSLLFASSLEMGLTVIAMLSDSVIAGHAVGETGISAINIITPIMSFTVFLSAMFSGGLSFCYSSALGRFDTRRASGLFGMGVILSAATSLVVFAGTSIYFEAYLDFLNLSPEIRAYVMEYYSCYRFVLLVMPFSQLMFKMVYDDGDDFISNIANTMNILGNIVLSLIFTFVFRMGMFGVALGTLLKEILSLAILSCHFLRRTNSLHARLHFSFRDMWLFMEYGFADAGMFVMIGALVFVMTKFVTEFFGELYLPVLSVAVGLLEISVVFDGVAQAMLPVVGVYYSENNSSGVRKVMKSAVRVSVLEGIAFSVLVYVFAEYVPALFDINSPELVPLCVSAVRIISTSFVASSLLYLFETYYVIEEKAGLVFVSMLLRNFVLVAVISMPLGLGCGLNAVWAGFALAQVLTMIVCGVLSMCLYGREGFPMYLKRDANAENYDLVLSPENVLNTRDEIGRFLHSHNIASKTEAVITLIVEEIGMLMCEKNREHKVLAEYTVMVDEGHSVTLIVRNDGQIFDLTDEDASIESFRAFVVSNIMMRQRNKKSLVTLGMNRMSLILSITYSVD